MSVRITCINKSGGYHENPHEAISKYGWENETTGEAGKSNRQQMVDFLENKNGEAYVKDSSGSTAYCYVRTSSNGNKFLQTYSDGQYTNNLLSLSECV